MAWERNLQVTCTERRENKEIDQSSPVTGSRGEQRYNSGQKHTHRKDNTSGSVPFHSVPECSASLLKPVVYACSSV